MTKKLKKGSLQAVNKELNALVKKTESLLKAVDKLEKPKAAKKPKAKPAKAKAPKKAPAKKAVDAVKKAAAPVTTADAVLAIINRSKKGVNSETLVKKTGYNQKKISNLIYKLRKQGKIKSPEKGIYVKA